MSGNRKFKSLVHYICFSRTSRPDTLGAVKLNKILWLADMAAFYETGKAITESRYIKQQFGPVPAGIVTVLRELQKEGALAITESTHFGKPKKVFRALVQMDGLFLQPRERTIVDRVIDYVCDDHTAKSVSDFSHDHVWKAAADGEEIPLFTVFAKPGQITDAERLWARTQLESENA